MKLLIILIVILFYLIIKFLHIIIKFDLSDIIALLSIFIDILMPIIIGYYLQNKFLVNRNLKSYHISLCDLLINDYRGFIDDLSKGCLNRREISSKFKMFSIRFNSIDTNNFNRFKTNIKLQDINRSISILITQSNEFNSSPTSSKVKFKNSTITDLHINFEKLLKANGDVIFDLNK